MYCIATGHCSTILFRRFGAGDIGDGVAEDPREKFELERAAGARGNAEKRFALKAPTVGLGRDFSLVVGDPDELGGISGKSVSLLMTETGRLLGGCGGHDLDVEVDERERDCTGTGRGSSLWGVGGGMLSSDGVEETVEETELSRANSGGSIDDSDPLEEGGNAPSLVWNGLVTGGLSGLYEIYHQEVISKRPVSICNPEAYTTSMVTGGINFTVSRLGSRSLAEAYSPLDVDN